MQNDTRQPFIHDRSGKQVIAIFKKNEQKLTVPRHEMLSHTVVPSLGYLAILRGDELSHPALSLSLQVSDRLGVRSSALPY